MLGSGYSQVPLAPDSALAMLTMTAIEGIRARRRDRRNAILEKFTNNKKLVRSGMDHGVRPRR